MADRRGPNWHLGIERLCARNAPAKINRNLASQPVLPFLLHFEFHSPRSVPTLWILRWAIFGVGDFRSISFKVLPLSGNHPFGTDSVALAPTHS